MTIDDFSLMISAESEAAAAARVVGVVVGVEELEAVAFRFGAFELTLLLPSVSKYGSLIVRHFLFPSASICPFCPQFTPASLDLCSICSDVL